MLEQLKLKPEVKALWVDALTNGKYTQAQERLRTSEGFCCLGVLCDIYKDATGDGSWVDADVDSSSDYEFKGFDMAPPAEVLTWAFENFVHADGNTFDWHARDVNVIVPGEVGDGTGKTLASRNDAGDSFETIATVIKDYL